MKSLAELKFGNQLQLRTKCIVALGYTILTGLIYSYNGYAQFTILAPPSTCQVIEDIDVDNAGRILFATDDGILVYDTNQTWLHFNNTNGLTYSNVKAIKHNGSDIIFSEMNKKIGTCNYTSASDTTFNTSFNYGYVSALYVDSLGQIFFGTDNGAAFSLDTTGNINQMNLSITLGTICHFSFITNPPLNSTNFFGIASSNKGLLFNAITQQALLVVSTATTPIPSNNIICSSFNEGFVYDGTDHGLFKVDFNNFPTVVPSVLNHSNSPLPSDTINAIAVSGTSMYVGTTKGLAICMNNSWNIYNISNSNLPSDEIGEVALNNNELWIGTKQGQICKIDTNQFLNFIHPISNQAQSSVFVNSENSLININTSVAGQFYLYDAFGNLIKKLEIRGTENTFPISNFSDGIYFYQLMASQGNILRSGRILICH